MIKISLIIPVFNAADFISKCIQSALAQTLQDIEIILVNDGSTDNSSALLYEFVENDPRIRIINQQNKGVSTARNKGLEVAKGEWVAFADADDWMEPEMLKTLYENAVSTKAGMAVCNVKQVQKGKTTERLQLKNELFDFKQKPESAVEKLMDFKYDYANWNKLYRADLIRLHRIRFDEHISIGEDLLFNLYYLHFIEKVICLDSLLYNYHVHEKSAMAVSAGKRVEQYNLQFKAYKKFTAKFGLLKEWETFRRIMARGFYNTLIPVIINNIKEQKTNRSVAVKVFCNTIAKLDAELFYYPDKKTGLQALKMKLLEQGKFVLFSRIVGIKYF